jgi:hypothetical protein
MVMPWFALSPARHRTRQAMSSDASHHHPGDRRDQVDHLRRLAEKGGWSTPWNKR